MGVKLQAAELALVNAQGEDRIDNPPIGKRIAKTFDN